MELIIVSREDFLRYLSNIKGLQSSSIAIKGSLEAGLSYGSKNSSFK